MLSDAESADYQKQLEQKYGNKQEVTKYTKFLGARSTDKLESYSEEACTAANKTAQDSESYQVKLANYLSDVKKIDYQQVLVLVKLTQRNGSFFTAEF